MNNEVGRLIKGVIYEDVDKDSMTEDMFKLMDNIYEIKDEQLKKYPSTRAMMSEGFSFDETKQYYQNMDSIAALTRYNFATKQTHNLIIPKESLSNGMVYELEKLDLGKDLLQKYADRFFEVEEEIIDVVPEDFIDSEEEKLLQEVDNNIRLFVDGKKVNKEEFEVFLQNNPDIADMFKACKTLVR